MNIEVLQRIILDFQKSERPPLTRRDLEITPIANMSFAVVGSRRCGKTFRTYQYASELIERGVARENICRIQFHDPRLRTLSVDDLPQIDTAYFALYPEKQGKEDIFFIVFVGLLGPIVEVICVYYGVWGYGNPSFLNIPIWLPVAYSYFGLIVRRMAITNIKFFF